MRVDGAKAHLEWIVVQCRRVHEDSELSPTLRRFAAAVGMAAEKALWELGDQVSTNQDVQRQHRDG